MALHRYWNDSFDSVSWEKAGWRGGEEVGGRGRRSRAEGRFMMYSQQY
jgi:hypothetical protein